MEMQQVRYFVALARELNFTRAAEACNVSQPALTRAIQALEDEFGGPLFHRDKTQTQISELGRMMLPHVQDMLAQTEAAKERARKFKQVANTELKLGAMCTIAAWVMADLLVKFREQFQDVTLTLRDYDSTVLIDGLLKGALEVAVTSVPDGMEDKLHAIPLYTEEFVVVLPPNHPLAAKPVLKVWDLDGHPYVNRINCEVFLPVSEKITAMGVKAPMVFRSERDAKPASPSASAPAGAPASAPQPPEEPRKKTFAERFAKWVLITFFTAIALFGVYTWASLNYTYSEGERVGYARKLSHRGWLCKTWEGEVAMSNQPGTHEQVFAFTVRDEAVVEQFRALEGKHVVVLYRERKGVPTSCFGDTPYHAYGVRAVK
jgi:DNA-binding transcriptional LysR family regulator